MDYKTLAQIMLQQQFPAVNTPEAKRQAALAALQLQQVIRQMQGPK
jgi:hypothetical protein